MNTLQDRLKQFITSLDLSVLAFENECGMAQGTVNKMTDKSRQRTLEKIRKHYPQLNMEWLQTGVGEMLNQPPSVDINLDSRLGGHSQMALRDITNIGDAKAQILILQERVKSLEKELKSKDSDLKKAEENKKSELAAKDAIIDELRASLNRVQKMNDYLMGQK